MRERRGRPKLQLPEGLDTVLERSGESRFARSKPPISREIWVGAVGFRVADRAHPMALDRGILTLRVTTSVWASELSLLADSIVSRLRDAGIDVRELRFRVAPLPTADRPPERRTSRKVPPPAPLPRELHERIRHVEDPELRHILSTCASESLAWQDAATAQSAAAAQPPTSMPAEIPQRKAARRSSPSSR